MLNNDALRGALDGGRAVDSHRQAKLRLRLYSAKGVECDSTKARLPMRQMAEYADDRPSNAAEVSDAVPQVSADQLIALRRDGFLLVKGLSSKEEIESLRAPFDRIFSERRGWKAGDLFDMIGTDSPEQGLALPQ